MMPRIPKICRQGECGFMLMELMIAIVITGIIIIGVSTLIFQVLAVNAMSSNTLTVTKQVESALHHLNRDVQMSENITGTETEWLVLEWAWDDGNHRVAYEIEGDRLFRSHTISGSLESRSLVAQYIDTDLMNWELITAETAAESANITVAASVGGYEPATAIRTIQVLSRVTPAGG
jgi:hypothetical protein